MWMFSLPDSSLVVSKATLVICPASLVHHWKKEIERHVKTGRLSVYLYHGPNRQKNAALYAQTDIHTHMCTHKLTSYTKTCM